MSAARLTKRAFELLAELEAHNEREWFKAHRKDIDALVREPFAQVLEEASIALAKHPAVVPLSGGKNTMFRMNRDVRFSKDKRPYNASVSGLLTPSGDKGEDRGLLYLQVDKSGGMHAGGFYKRSAAQLLPLRERIVEEPKAWAKVLAALEKGGLALKRDQALKTMPRGFEAYADHEHAEDLKLTSLVVWEPLPKRAWLRGEVVDTVAATATAIGPLLRFGDL